MEKILQELTHAERVQELENQAVKIEKKTYFRTISEDELNVQKTEYIDLCSDLQRQRSESADKAGKMKEEITKLNGEISEGEKSAAALLNAIQGKKRQSVGRVFWIPNFVEGKMYFYDAQGELLESRELLETERNGSLFADKGEENAQAEEEQQFPNIAGSAPAPNGQYPEDPESNLKPEDPQGTPDPEGPKADENPAPKKRTRGTNKPKEEKATAKKKQE